MTANLKILKILNTTNIIYFRCPDSNRKEKKIYMNIFYSSGETRRRGNAIPTYNITSFLRRSPNNGSGEKKN